MNGNPFFSATGEAVRTLIFAVVITIGSCIACYLAAGASLDFFLGCVLFASLICPILVSGGGLRRDAPVIAASVWIVEIIAWGIVAHSAGVHFFEWISISLIFAGSIGVMTAATRSLMHWHLSPVLAAAIVTISQLLWLTWPIWLSPSIPGAETNWSVSVHPLLAINGVLKDLGIWTEQPIAYNLTTLGQDVEYRLPTSAWPTVAAHGVAIVVLLIASRVRKISFVTRASSPFE